MKQKIKCILSFLLACQLFLMTVYAKPDWPTDTGIQAEAGIVVDMDSGAVLFGQNVHVGYPPASITKILTALLVLENCQLDEVVTFSQNAVYNVEADCGNKTSVVAGDQLTVEDCLYSLLLVSSNQTANALAEHVAGSMSAFVDMMNEKLEELGCTESHFDNPSGLNGDTQYVSAYDMTKIASAAYQNEELVKISSVVYHKIAPTTNNPEGFTLKNEHRLVITEDETSEFYYPPAVAGKTGYLIAAGNTLVTYAEQDGRQLVSVILKGQPRQYFIDCKELLSFGFRNFTNLEIAQYESRYVTGDGPIELDGITYKSSDLMVEPGKMVTLPNGTTFEDAEIALGPLPESHPDNAVAQLTYTYNERIIGQAFLLVKDMPAFSQEVETAPNSDANISDNNSDSAAGSNTDSSGKFQLPSISFDSSVIAVLLKGIAILIPIGLIVGGICYWQNRRKKEAEAMELRREQRRRRIQESGDEEEYERLMEEYRNRHSNVSQKQNGQKRRSILTLNQESFDDFDEQNLPQKFSENDED
ncbi:MAG: D-alanyl-D-alanine carboxypeptidase family protein [Brotaphodocola sp.]